MSENSDRYPDPPMIRASNGNLWISPHPPEALALLEDPRLDGMTDALPGFGPARRDLVPAEFPSGESRYLRMKDGFNANPGRNVGWPNRPGYRMLNGRGLGFDEMPQRPRMEDPRKAPKKLFHCWEFGGYFVASPDMVDLLNRLAPDSIVTKPIDWVFSDGQCLDSYVFVDFIRLHYAYDYRRSEVVVEMREGKKSMHLGLKRALRDDIPSELQIFRDAVIRDVLVSRSLAEEILSLASRELCFENVHTSWSVELTRKRAPRNLKARLKPAEVVVDDPSMPMGRRISLRVSPLLQRSAFAEAEAALLQLLQELSPTPYHVIADLRITTSVEDCAKYFDEFLAKAKREQAVKAVYTEMNGFTINPDLWFCDASAIPFHGGTDNFDWLGDAGVSTDESLVITGLEPLQAVYAQRRGTSPPAGQNDADIVAGSLVIVKFQRLLQDALPHMKQLKCPLYATAHDDDEFIAEIKPVSS
jgi:hypothetical protein